MTQIFRALLPYAHIGVAILLGVTILLQQKGTGLGAAFGGGDAAFYRTKRGLEKLLLAATIVLGILFVALSVLAVILR